MLTSANLLHLINPLRHLLQLRSDRGKRLQDGSIVLCAGLGRIDAAGELFRARLPPGNIRSQCACLVRRRRSACHRAHVPEERANH